MSMPDMVAVDSSNVAAVGYDAEEQEIYVEFRDSGLYKYTGPDQQTFDELVEAPSVGSFLNRAIKPNYPYARL